MKSNDCCLHACEAENLIAVSPQSGAKGLEDSGHWSSEEVGSYVSGRKLMQQDR